MEYWPPITTPKHFHKNVKNETPKHCCFKSKSQQTHLLARISIKIHKSLPYYTDINENGAQMNAFIRIWVENGKQRNGTKIGAPGIERGLLPG